MDYLKKKVIARMKQYRRLMMANITKLVVSANEEQRSMISGRKTEMAETREALRELSKWKE